MITVPPNLQARFKALLVSKAVPKQYHVYYYKWIRYYWDFCHKYGFSASKDQSLPQFVAKLREKKQKEFQIKQAADAVSIYYEIVDSGKKFLEASRQIPNLDGKKDIEETGSPLGSQPIIEKAKNDDGNGPLYRSPPPSCATVNEPPIDAYGTWQSTGKGGISGKDSQRKLEATKTGTSWEFAFDGLHSEIKVRHYSPKTLKNYSAWLGKFQAFTKTKPLASLCDQDIKDFLTFLAVERNVAASTQNQAFNALLFFFRHVLKKEPGDLKNIPRAKRRPYIPVVLSRQEINRVLLYLSHPYDLIVKLLYGCGLRLFECLNLRIHNFNLDARILTVHDGKGKKDRTVPIPDTIIAQIQRQMEDVEAQHLRDLKSGYDGAFMFGLIEKKYKNAGKELIWQWFFPGFAMTRVPETSEKRRYHIHERHVQKAIKAAVRRAKLYKRVTAHTFRHSYATHLLEANYDIRTIQDLLGHSDIRTTMIYTHTIKSRTIKEAKSPLDFQISG